MEHTTVKQIAELCGVSRRTVLTHVNKLFPGKMEGKKLTRFDEKEATRILDSIKRASINANPEAKTSFQKDIEALANLAAGIDIDENQTQFLSIRTEKGGLLSADGAWTGGCPSAYEIGAGELQGQDSSQVGEFSGPGNVQVTTGMSLELEFEQIMAAQAKAQQIAEAFRAKAIGNLRAQLQDSRAKVAEHAAKVEQLQVKLDSSKEWATVKRVDAVTNTAHDWRLLKAHSISNGIEIKKVFDQNYGEINSYHASAWKAVYNFDIASIE
jgi:hypothetical protein